MRRVALVLAALALTACAAETPDFVEAAVIDRCGPVVDVEQDADAIEVVAEDTSLETVYYEVQRKDGGIARIKRGASGGFYDEVCDA